MQKRANAPSNRLPPFTICSIRATGQHDAAGRYSPAPIVEQIIKIRDGHPDSRHISTSYVEALQPVDSHGTSQVYETHE